jgi:hypothetical protein
MLNTDYVKKPQFNKNFWEVSETEATIRTLALTPRF